MNMVKRVKQDRKAAIVRSVLKKLYVFVLSVHKKADQKTEFLVCLLA